MFPWAPCAPVMRWAAHLLCIDPRPRVPLFLFVFCFFYVEGWIWLFSQPSAPLSPVWYLKLLTSCLARVGSDDGNRTVMAGTLLLHLLSSHLSIEFADSTSIFSPGETEAQSGWVTFPHGPSALRGHTQRHSLEDPPARALLPQGASSPQAVGLLPA